ncbi:MAG: TonB-dependent receptor [Hyphomonadaceae bacterium]
MKPISLPWHRLALLTTFLVSPAIAVAQQTPATPQAEATVTQEQPPEDAADDSDVIVVLGRYIPEPQQVSTAVASFLTADDLDRQGDANAASALTRLAGLSVVSGRFVYVRGLGDRYSSALLNGSPLPSPEPLRRQVPLDLFPSNILAGATVQKTFSPNYPGEFGGGIIDLRTLSNPDYPFLTMKLGTGGNTTSTGKRGLVYRGHDEDWYGFDHTLRDIPADIQQAIATGQRINTANFSDAQLEVLGESLVNSPLTVIQSERLQPDFEGEITGGTALDFDNFSIGLVGVAGYDSQMRTQVAHRQDINGGIIRRDSEVETTDWDIVFNAFGSAGISWDDNQITATGLFVRSTTKKAQIGENLFDANRAGTPPVHSESTAWYQRELGTVQLAGEHKFDAFKLNWRTAYAESTRDAPYERFVNYIRTPIFPLFYDAGATQDNGTTFSDLTDQVVSGGVDGSYEIPIDAGRTAILSAGVDYSNAVRVYNQRAFTFDAPFPAQLAAGCETPVDDPSTACSLAARVDYLFSPDNIRPDGFVLTEITTPDSSYKARLTQWAAYAMADVDILPLVHLNVGTRYEDASEVVRTFNTVGEAPRAVPTQLNNSYWLPSATLTWNFADDLQARFAYSQTIARPQFRELAFSAYIDPETDRVYRGNPYLQDSKFDNYDTRLEWYFGENQFTTLSGFFKKIERPIEEVISANTSGDVTTQFLNAPEAQLYGVEAEYRTWFEMPFDLLPFLEAEEWIFGVNYTYTKSEVKGVDDLVVDVTQLPNLVTVPASRFQLDGSQLQGTPENIFNLQFGFETPETQLTLLVGWVDERIARRGLGGIPSVIEKPGVNVDLVFHQDIQFGDTVLSLGLSGRNLLNEDHEEYQTSAAGKTDANTYERGRSFSASLTAKF